LLAVNDVVVFAMLVPAVAKLSSEDSHLVTEPVFPLKVSVVELVPVQTVALPAIVPPTEAGETVIVPVAFTVPQPPTKRMLYGYVPATDGVPKIVIVLLFHEAATPGGRPLAPAVPAFAIPVAPVVV